MYTYFPDRLPAQRQLIIKYQLCDIDIMDDQLQKIIHSNDGKEKECTVSVCTCLNWSYHISRKFQLHVCIQNSVHLMNLDKVCMCVLCGWVCTCKYA